VVNKLRTIEPENVGNTLSRSTEINMDDLRALIVSQKTTQPTDAEMFVFKRLCESLGANPFLRDIHIVKYSSSSPASFITGKDFFTKVARSQGATWEAGVLVIRNGELVEQVGSFTLSSDELVGGWAKVHTKDGMIPTTVSFTDYDTGKNLWVKMPGTMIRKVALVGALREAFPERFAGAYSAEEMDQAPQFEDIDLVKSIETIDDSYSATPVEEMPSTEKMATEKQINFLKRLGYEDPEKLIEELSLEEAKLLIDQKLKEKDEPLSPVAAPKEMTKDEVIANFEEEGWSREDIKDGLGMTLTTFLEAGNTPFAALEAMRARKQATEK
jgi:phage recombination protein Bet